MHCLSVCRHPTWMRDACSCANHYKTEPLSCRVFGICFASAMRACIWYTMTYCPAEEAHTMCLCRHFNLLSDGQLLINTHCESRVFRPEGCRQRLTYKLVSCALLNRWNSSMTDCVVAELINYIVPFVNCTPTFCTQLINAQVAEASWNQFSLIDSAMYVRACVYAHQDLFGGYHTT